MRIDSLSIISVLLFPATASADISGSLCDECMTGNQALVSTQIYSLCYSIDITGEAIGMADFMFLTDTTGSIGSYIGRIRSAFISISAAIDSSLSSLDIEYCYKMLMHLRKSLLA